MGQDDEVSEEEGWHQQKKTVQKNKTVNAGSDAAYIFDDDVTEASPEKDIEPQLTSPSEPTVVGHSRTGKAEAADASALSVRLAASVTEDVQEAYGTRPTVDFICNDDGFAALVDHPPSEMPDDDRPSNDHSSIALATIEDMTRETTMDEADEENDDAYGPVVDQTPLFRE